MAQIKGSEAKSKTKGFGCSGSTFKKRGRDTEALRQTWLYPANTESPIATTAKSLKELTMKGAN